MTTITELIEYLKTLPTDTELFVVSDGARNFLEINENTYFTDLTGNQFVKEGDSRYNKKYLTFGYD